MSPWPSQAEQPVNKEFFKPQRPMSRRLVAMSTVLAFVPALTGCFSLQSPPESWPAPQLEQTIKCADLSGSYRNIGENAEGGKSWPLALKVFPTAAKNWTTANVETGERFRAASHVTFSGPNAKGLLIEAWQGDELIGTIARSEPLGGGFSCDDGVLAVSLPVTATALSGVFFDTFQQAKLSPASDGSLIVRTRSTGIGLGFYIIPVLGQFVTWDHYPKVSKSTLGSDQANFPK